MTTIFISGAYRGDTISEVHDNIERARQRLDTSFPTANAAVKVLEELGIVAELTGQKKNRSYSYQAYIELLSR